MIQTPSKRRTDGRTDRRREYNSRRLSVRPFVTSRSDGGDRWTLLPCVFDRPSVRLLGGVWH